MRTVELFAGTQSFSDVMRKHKHDTFTIDNTPGLAPLPPDLLIDIREVSGRSKPLKQIDLLWASPPCQGFSVAVIGRNWNYDKTPKTASAKLAMELVLHTLGIIKTAKPKYWFIENPRGMLRKMPFMEGFIRHTVSYCQYGDTRQKPTDIWTNAEWWHPKPICERGAPCHVGAPRGSRTGTQGIKGAKDRGKIPAALFEEILAQMP